MPVTLQKPVTRGRSQRPRNLLVSFVPKACPLLIVISSVSNSCYILKSEFFRLPQDRYLFLFLSVTFFLFHKKERKSMG
ncbi:Uncharacterized protein dnm_070340 [Desulfonema magnum]|uniref:Uncharacterized protein n=1 Tax=Desulfonema magnum TaxID=45655 RepID=A0A975BTQ2_9BACT|nr:Uncharacterized protein dnm_070340 [Desulfonema magnum]